MVSAAGGGAPGHAGRSCGSIGGAVESAARGARHAIPSGRRLGPPARGLVVRRSHERRRRRQRQRLGLQPGQASRSSSSIATASSCARGARGSSGAPTASPSGPTARIWLTDDLHHTIRQFTPEGKLLLTIGDPDKAVHAARWQAVQSPDPRGLCPKTGDIVHLRRVRQLASAQVRSQGPAPALVGRAGHRSRLLQPSAQHRHRRRRASSTWPTARTTACRSSTASGQYLDPVEQPAPAVRALLPIAARRRPLRRRAAAPTWPVNAAGAQRRGARQHPVHQGRAGGAGRWALRRREAGRVRRAARGARWTRAATSTWRRSRTRREGSHENPPRELRSLQKFVRS